MVGCTYKEDGGASLTAPGFINKLPPLLPFLSALAKWIHPVSPESPS